MKRENILLLIVVVVILTTAGFWIFNYSTGFFKNQPEPKGIILFYGDGCSHCANVDKFISDNNIKEKISFAELEVFNNQNNAGVLLEKAKACGLDTNLIGVPFLWNGKTCVLGDQDIIKFFQDRINTTVK